MADHKARADERHPDVLPPDKQLDVADALLPDRPMQVRATKNCYYGDIYRSIGDEFTIAKTSDFVADYMDKVEPTSAPKEG